jgi:hypothetical protein
MIPVTARLPWQAVRGSHIEISWKSLSVFWSFGVIVFGMALKMGQVINPSKPPDALLSFASAMSIALMMAWVCLLGFGFFSMGMLWEIKEFFYGVLAAGVLTGVILGFRTNQQRCRSRITPDTGGNGPCDAAPITSPEIAEGDRRGSSVMNLFWFMLGSIGGFGFLILEMFVEPIIPRGNRIGTNPLGGARYDRDQFPIDVTVGLAMALVGWILGITLIKLGMPRWLGIGLIVTTSALAIMFPF